MSFMKEFIPGIDGEGEKDEGECDDDDEEVKEEEEEESFDEGGGILHPPLSMMRGRRKVDTESLGSRALDPQFRTFLCNPHPSALPALILHFQHLLSQALAAERVQRAQKWYDFVNSSFTTNQRPL